MPRGTPKQPVERLITITAIHHMKSTLREVNDLLKQAGFGPMNISSYEQERLQYGPSIFEDIHKYTLREHIYRPRRRSNLKDS